MERNITFEDTTTLTKPTNRKWNSRACPQHGPLSLRDTLDTGASPNNNKRRLHRPLQWMRKAAWRETIAESRLCLFTTQSMTYRPQVGHKDAHGGQLSSTLSLPPSLSSFSSMPNPSFSPATSRDLILDIRPHKRACPIPTSHTSSRSKHTL